MQKLIIISIIFIYACNSWRAPLKITREPMQSTLNIDGVYYNKKLLYFYLYKNGIFWGGNYASSLSSITSSNMSNYYNDVNFRNQTPQDWGAFRITGGEIFIEKWRSGDAGSRFEITAMSGKVLNDTTLYLQGKPFGCDTFYFHRKMPKPDSTNRFIK